MGRYFPVACLLWCLSCSAPVASSPRGAVDAYQQALREQRYRDAYELLSLEARKEISLAEFEEQLRKNPAETQALIESLETPSGPAYVTAQVTTQSGQKFLLIYEDGAWRLDESALRLYSQATPEQALASFVRAFDAKRYDILLRFVPEVDRADLDEQVLREAWEGEQKVEMEQIVERMRRGLVRPQIELVGNRATWSYGAGSTVELVFEHGLWKIEDFQ